MNLKPGITPVVWSIAGADPSGGAGLQADTRAITSLGGYACGIVSALTAQNTRRFDAVKPDADFLLAQAQTLLGDLPPRAVKIGLLADTASVKVVGEILAALPRETPVVMDPVIAASAGHAFWSDSLLAHARNELFSKVTVLTPNLSEAERLTGLRLNSPSEVETAARALLACGPRAVIIKGGHGTDSVSRDFFITDSVATWLNSPRLAKAEARGTGCTFSAALATALAFGFGELDSAIIAKTYVQQALRRRLALSSGAALLPCCDWPGTPDDLPWTSDAAGWQRLQFAGCGPEELGFYPIVPRAAWLERLLPLGVSTVQLRIKDLAGEDLAREIRAAIAIARRTQCRLFINDHWRLAIEFGAYGVHLGQEDLEAADLGAIARAELRLGVSTHSFAELARAQALGASYLALGPIFPTKIKVMRFGPQGLSNLRIWRALCGRTPLVAIGGLTLETADDVLACGPDGLAVVSDIIAHNAPEARVRAWLQRINAAQLKVRLGKSNHRVDVEIR